MQTPIASAATASILGARVPALGSEITGDSITLVREPDPEPVESVVKFLQSLFVAVVVSAGGLLGGILSPNFKSGSLFSTAFDFLPLQSGFVARQSRSTDSFGVEGSFVSKFCIKALWTREDRIALNLEAAQRQVRLGCGRVHPLPGTVLGHKVANAVRSSAFGISG